MPLYEIIGREGVPVADDFHHISIGNLVSPLVVDRLTGTFYTLKADRTVVTLGVASAGVATFLATPSSANLASAITDETGSGALVFANSPTLITPALGTPASGTLTNCAGLPISSGVAGLASGVAAFLADPTSAKLATAVTNETGSGALVFAESPTLVTPALGTPASGTLTNCTGLPISSGVSGLGANVATFLATPSSANLAAAITDESGTGTLPLRSGSTWTPVPFGSGTAGSPTGTFEGSYVRVGDLIFVSGRLVFTNLSTMAGDLRCSGLPVTASASLIAMRAVPVYYRANFTNDFPITGFVLSGTGTLVFYSMSADASPVSIGDLSATSEIYFSGIYQA